jgi:hypothetical protein
LIKSSWQCMANGTNYEAVCCILSLGDSPASEFYCPAFRNTVCSIFIGCVNKKNNWNATECSETSAHKIHTLGNHPKERIQRS